MGGIGVLIDVWRKNLSFSSKALNVNSANLLSTTLAVSAAASASASLFSGQTLASKLLFGGAGVSVAYSDTGVEFTEDYISKLRNVPGISGNIFWNETLKYSTKQYPIELRPLFSAFAPRSFALTALRSFLLFYLPLLEPPSLREEDDDDFPEEVPESQGPDLVTPFKKSVKQMVREVSVVTTRRVLERLAVHYSSQRVAWKLVKDIPRSAKRKALRGMSSPDYFYCVSRTTFRGHLLGTAAAWLVQIGIEIYRCVSDLINCVDDDKVERINLLGKRVVSGTIKLGASLVCASVGAGIGAFVHPSLGVTVGYTLGDLAGPILIVIVLEKCTLTLQ